MMDNINLLYLILRATGAAEDNRGEGIRHQWSDKVGCPYLPMIIYTMEKAGIKRIQELTETGNACVHISSYKTEWMENSVLLSEEKRDVTIGQREHTSIAISVLPLQQIIQRIII
jgi:hypothetical protein